MPAITLPDGSQKHFDHPVSVAEVAASIGSGLAKAALAGKVNGALVDTSASIDRDATLSIVTDKDPEGLEIIRHSTAHLLANAVQELFPDAQVTIGPVVENGFYYDFAYKRPFSTEDLAAIEKRMARDFRQGFESASSRAAPGRGHRAFQENRRALQGRDHCRDSAGPNPSACTGRVRGRICAAGRTFRAPANSRLLSS